MDIFTYVFNIPQLIKNWIVVDLVDIRGIGNSLNL